MASAMQCALKACPEGQQLAWTDKRVEVKGFAVPAAKQKGFQACWREDGEAAFHRDCWLQMVGSCKRQKPFTLISSEADLMGEAMKTAEIYDDMETVRKEAARIANMLKESKHAVIFTGAGISTSAGIGDFRGKGGKWTERDREKNHGTQTKGAQRKRKGFTYPALRPTYTHEAICKLVDMGLLKFIISQNCDGLHRLSGVPRSRIAELHGNVFHERCELCNARYERPFAVRSGGPKPSVPPKPCKHCKINHRTGRKCERKNCNGYLMNTVINFGDNLEDDVLSGAITESEHNDLMLAFGSSLRVTPACDLVEMGRQPLRLVICNRQKTPFDDACYTVIDAQDGPVGARVHCDCDLLMQEIMKHVLPSRDLKEWEDGRERRMDEYALQRMALS